jgi:hypothetical protein
MDEEENGEAIIEIECEAELSFSTLPVEQIAPTYAQTVCVSSELSKTHASVQPIHIT